MLLRFFYAGVTMHLTSIMNKQPSWHWIHYENWLAHLFYFSICQSVNWNVLLQYKENAILLKISFYYYQSFSTDSNNSQYYGQTIDVQSQRASPNSIFTANKVQKALEKYIMLQYWWCKKHIIGSPESIIRLQILALIKLSN